jgi:hypothetical protein
LVKLSFNFLTHKFSILKRNISDQNAMHNIAILPWFAMENFEFAGAA